MRAVNSARERVKPDVVMLAILFAITSRFCSWALMPVAAIASALIPHPPLPLRTAHAAKPRSDRHSRNLLISGDRLVADRENGLQRTLRRHHRLDHFHRRRCAFDALDGDRLAGLQRVDRRPDRLREPLVEARPLRRRGGGLRAANARALARGADGGNAFDHRLIPAPRPLAIQASFMRLTAVLSMSGDCFAT